MRNRKRDYKFKGLHFHDPFFEWLRGYAKRKTTTRDAMKLSNETLNHQNLFPLRSIPVPNKPGYVTHDYSYFRIRTRGKIIQRDMNNYFLNKYYMSRDKRIGYTSQGDELGNLLNTAYAELVIHGISAYSVEWGEVNIDGKKYELPIDFSWINPATLKFNKNGEYFASQKYSWVSREAEDYFNYENHYFKREDILVFKHPTSFPVSPVGKSLKFVRDIQQWVRFSLWQGKASNEPGNHSLYLETARYKASEDVRRKESIARVRVRRIFKLPIGDYGVGLTAFYEVYSYAEYLKQLNIARDSIITSFCEQIFKEVQKRNGIASQLELEHRGFTSNSKIDNVLNRFKKRGITASDFVEMVEDKKDGKLY